MKHFKIKKVNILKNYSYNYSDFNEILNFRYRTFSKFYKTLLIFLNFVYITFILMLKTLLFQKFDNCLKLHPYVTRVT